ncbi:ion transporter [Anabaena cylindrica FACHB-243]|uniref:Ion transport 2 domain protein n=1 Tax=Anabaena cylindrica (strain ATCC 27899 / PCC 7122) TaxID=272123 RepID=K9ZLW3_ANACC|nr:MULTISPECIES: ion transporter [Anabaena]AFZ59547.1 Ion transport 2 domain protein [Anabaena cylindrica PCC 7122]MBD2418787.1 ion transporter [Anabaena cylindrica FACHB-243]MBY5284773.1 ion transporter [Anabaena sp. CCAP 1446/1C]MBY5310160.1 ion transporter [Anabaena sp. CCAP 1446/1C]MCM2406352.1 ion transporter [Anabaena sp. CCAP 1446/1C]
MLLNREKIEFYLTDLETPIGKAINLTIATLILLSSGIFVAETYNISDDALLELKALDACILIIFALEYLLRLWSAENKFKYIFSFYSIIDLMAILPSFVGLVDISFIRLLRWFRILRLIRFIDKRFLIGSISSEDGVIFARILFTLFAIVFVYSGLIYQVEHPVNPQNFGTFLDAFYFSVVTMTTVGFGDVTPISELGRLLTVLMILTGVGLIPWQVGDLIKRLVKTANQVEKICTNCGLAFHDLDAEFCKRCGTKLPILKVD